MPPKLTARFIEPMLLLRTDALPKDADRWEYQPKLDGYRAIAFQDGRMCAPSVPQRQRFQHSLSGRRQGPCEAARRG
jgi:hypothetical protein